MLKNILKTALGFLFVIILSGIFLFTTQAGLRFGFAVVSKVVPGELSAQQLSGKLLDAVVAKNFRYENKNIKIVVGDVKLKLKASDLLLANFTAPVLDADDIKINLKDNKDASKQSLVFADVLEGITNTVKMVVKLQDVRLSNLSFQTAKGQPLLFSQLLLKTDYSHGAINLLDVVFDSEHSNLVVHGSVKESWDIGWKCDFKNLALFDSSMAGSVRGFGKIYGERRAPILDANITVNDCKCDSFGVERLQLVSYIDTKDLQASSFKLNLLSPKFDNFSFNRLVVTGGVASNQDEKINWEINIGGTTAFLDIGKHGHSLKISHASVLGEIGRKGLSIFSKIFIDSNSIKINLELPLLNKLQDLFGKKRQPVKGSAVWQVNDLSFLEKVFPQVKNIKGVLDLNLYLSGSVQKPKVSGKTILNAEYLSISVLNTSWRNVVLEAQLSSNEIKYTGKTHSGLGSLNLNGKTIFVKGKNKFNTNFDIEGANFLLANNQKYYIVVSPQLSISNEGNILQLLGKVLIPEARLEPINLQASNSLPPETVYADEGEKKQEDDLNLRADLEIELGDRVNINMMGLKGKVTGKVNIKDEPKKSTTATGALRIKDGVYGVYGRELTITKGGLNFWGGPVSNPNVDFEAVRNFKKSAVPDYFSSENKELTVGVRVSGMISNPRIDLFSTPAGLAKPDILSYLITGQSSEDLSENQGQLLMQAASMLNFGGAGEVSSFMGGLKDNLGFDEFGFGSETVSNDQAGTISSLRADNNDSQDQSLTSSAVFVLGKYLTPKLYVSYTQGLVDSVNIFKVRYYMSKYWSVQSESNSDGASGIDLICSFER